MEATLPRPLEACVGRMKPEVLVDILGGGRAALTELPLDEDRDAGVRATGLGTGRGVVRTGVGTGARFTVVTDAALFSELLELRREARDVDRSTRNELDLFGTARFGSIGVRGGVLLSLVEIFFGTSDFVAFGMGESHSTLHPDDAPWDALSEFRLCVSSKPSSFNSCSLFTLEMRGEVVLSAVGIRSVFPFIDFLYAFLDQTPVGVSVGDLSSLMAFWTSSWFIEVCRLILEYGCLVSLVGVLSVLWLLSLSCQRLSLFSFSSFTSSIGLEISCGVSTAYEDWTSSLDGLITWVSATNSVGLSGFFSSSGELSVGLLYLLVLLAAENLSN